MIRHLLAVLLTVLLALPLAAQETDRSSTGGAQTLEDILARQAAQKVDNSFRSEALGDPSRAAPTTDQLGTLGGQSDAEIWRSLRFNEANITVSSGGDVASVLVTDSGVQWLKFREGPLLTYGAYLILATAGALVLFYLLRGQIKIDAPMSGRMVLRFKAIERFAHWLLAGSFIALGLTGTFVLFGRLYIAPIIGAEANATLLQYSKLVHNNVGWAFMLALVMVFVFWVVHNLPDRTDIKWFAQFGGIVGKHHPPAKKFNGGQKIIFWSVISMGFVISVTGVALLFPYQVPIFEYLNPVINQIGLAEAMFGREFAANPAPQQEMQGAQTLHSIAAMVLMAIVVAHIYIGTIGMQGASGAMTTGEVDEAWARQHHSIWLEEVKAEQADDAPGRASTPAE